MTALLSRLGMQFRLIAGNMNFELTSASHNKGSAVQSLLATETFTGRRPVYIGDDVTDEDAFSAVNELGGLSVRVGHTEHSLAAWQLDDIAAVRHWMRAMTCQT